MGNDRVCHARYAHVLFQDFYGDSAEHSPAWNVHDYLYRRISHQGIDTDLYLYPAKRTLCRFCSLVGTVSLYLDDSLGNYDVVSPKYANKVQMRGLSHPLLPSRICLWDIVRACIYADVWLDL